MRADWCSVFFTTEPTRANCTSFAAGASHPNRPSKLTSRDYAGTLWLDGKGCYETASVTHVLVWLWDQPNVQLLVITCVPLDSLSGGLRDATDSRITLGRRAG